MALAARDHDDITAIIGLTRLVHWLDPEERLHKPESMTPAGYRSVQGPGPSLTCDMCSQSRGGGIDDRRDLSEVYWYSSSAVQPSIWRFNPGPRRETRREGNAERPARVSISGVGLDWTKRPRWTPSCQECGQPEAGPDRESGRLVLAHRLLRLATMLTDRSVP